MKIKVGDKIYDANEEPVMLIFENEMQKVAVGQHLINMAEGARKYCMFPEGMDKEVIKAFMKTDGNKPLGIMEQIREREANKPPVRIEEEFQRMDIERRKPKVITLYGGFEFMKKIEKILPKKYFK